MPQKNKYNSPSLAKSQPLHPETILCSVHQLPIKLVREGDRMVAYCTCDVPGNTYSGQQVYNAPISAKETHE